MLLIRQTVKMMWCVCFVDILIQIINKSRNIEVQLADLQMENGYDVQFERDSMT